MNEKRATAIVLKAGMAVGVALCVIGLIVPEDSLRDAVLGTGLALLVFTPFAGVVATTAILAVRRDPWAVAGVALIAIVAAGLLASTL